LLQESHSTVDLCETWYKEWGMNAFFSGNSSNSAGVAILLKKNDSFSILNHTEIVIGRLQALFIEMNNKPFIIINLYGPNNDDVYIFNELNNFMLDHEDANFIIGGDFNTVLNEHIDKKNGKQNTHVHIRSKLTEIMTTFNLLDIWRIKHPEKRQFTWHSNTKPVVFSRLDYFLMSENITNIIKTSKIIPGYNSDHSIVNIAFDIVNSEKGPGFFKMNNSVILQNEY
jgi:exonuclease III